MGDDHAAITRLVYAYATAVDTGDLDTFGELFAHGTLAIAGTPVAATGAEAVRALLRKGLHWYPAPDGGRSTPRTQHLTANLSIELAESRDRAKARSSVMVFQALGGFALSPILGAHYDDDLVKDDRGWHFSLRVLTYDLLGDLSRHFTKPVPAHPAP